ncbi:unnamed protein product [Didymodactylos carnosus]|uniref:Secreted protein n=1 Tax=Didymodactylos carnosus TaxID=1234261 RepID=A0A813YR42_9BILA|nr:unnamed protein product [Didymodactylos carnosus]CAF0887728.1 unnamed protein product [Didymodactylos carnosus]CAF3577367.1 unnamed protein product [Didymodactylos carnosus]CAF3672648.1 unnamed protein product [Didymodactylos carnosus]
MGIRLISLLLLLVLTVRGHSEDDDQYRTKIKGSIKGVLKTVRNIVKSAEKFAVKMLDKLALKTSLKAGEKLTMKTSEKLAVKFVEKVASKGAVKFVGKTAGKLVKKLPYIGVAAGVAFGIWRIIDDSEDWQSYVLAAGELSSGVVSIVPGIGTMASTAIDAALLAFDLKYAKHEQHIHEEEQRQTEVDHGSEL